MLVHNVIPTTVHASNGGTTNNRGLGVLNVNLGEERQGGATVAILAKSYFENRLILLGHTCMLRAEYYAFKAREKAGPSAERRRSPCSLRS